MSVKDFKLHGRIFSEIHREVDGICEFAAFAAGRWIWGREFLEVRSPIDLKVIARIPKLGWDDINHVLDVVYSVGRWKIRDIPGWKRLNMLDRIAELMEENKKDLINSLVFNSGKTRLQAEGEVNASIDRLRRADMDSRKIYGEYVPGDWDPTTVETEAIIRREPLGVVLAIIPFNYPLFDTVSKLVYSVIAGNAVVVKPPSADPIPVILFAKLVEESGFPGESFSVLTIPGKESDRLVSDDRIQAISFTGSSKTGKRVIQLAGIKQFIMELGGGDPAIVLSDADLHVAAKMIAAGVYSYAGQRCDAIKLILVAKDVYGEFKEKLVSEFSRAVVGDPRDEKTAVGPLICPEAVEEMLKCIDEAIKAGGNLLYGGRRLGETYVEPSLVEILDKRTLRGLKLYMEEVFAPVAIITDFNDVDEAIEIANGRRYGLDAAIFGYNLDTIRKLIRFLEFGAIYINDMPRHGVGYYPFGGRKESGIGREGIGYSVEQVTAYKTIVYNFREKGVWRYLE
ncbi:MAG: NADP-dependent glyceraldehyde-3-phosphate dehydrogenase [Aigarchaeota archaeon]|nr:NADP-dependent glyceraldehyde-3-phosphate dehydrogenase [Aigarchaeota archaeon]MDW8021648.1 NADP-dependent glyceraldehyde-3-phosphate dehydrogenase [Nitrososphaerota archaeon]